MGGSAEDRISLMHGDAHCFLVAWLTVIELPSNLDKRPLMWRSLPPHTKQAHSIRSVTMEYI